MSAAEAAAAAMAGAKVFGDYQYLNRKFGKYLLQVDAQKFTDKGKPCFEFTVIKSEKTQADVEPYRAGEKVSHLEDLSNPKAGGAGRLLKALLAILHMTDAEISKLEETRTENGKTKVVELEGENAKKKWLIKMLDQTKQPTAFMQVWCEVEPRPVPAKDGKPAAVFAKERWTSADMTETELDAIDEKRVAANLPRIEDALT